MNELELSTLLGIVADPENNVYNINNRKDKQEIERIIRIFSMAKEQKIQHKMLSIKKMASFKLVMSNN